MSIILESLSTEQGPATRAQVRHGIHAFTALVTGSRESLLPSIGQECIVEMLFERAVNWHEISDFEDENSCIKASSTHPGAISIQGRVHSVLPIDSESSVVDLYLQTGPEFLAIDSKEIGGLVPRVGAALEITVYGLCFYPTNT